jgi:hypothetical protein
MPATGHEQHGEKDVISHRGECGDEQAVQDLKTNLQFLF